MRLVFIGPPGAGKGSIADILEKKTGMVHISTGDLFRENVAKNTELGEKISNIINAGDLVDDFNTFKVIKNELCYKKFDKGFILDGFPRDITQVNLMKFLTTVDWVINLKLSDDEVVKRISGRRVAPSSGRIYHIEYNPPKVSGIDDDTGESLVQRDDDKKEAISRRLEVYRKSTFPIVERFRNMGLLMDIEEGNMTAEQLADTILEKINYSAN